MNLGIHGKRALVTGAEHVLAQAIAAELSREGVLVALVSKDRRKLHHVLQAIGGSSKGHCAVCIDLNREGQANVLFKKLNKIFGGIDIVINCLDTYQYNGDSHISIDRWRRIFRSNLETAIEINNCLIPRMKRNGWGRIVNLSSSASMEHAATVSYCASKAALTAYTRCMGRVLAIEANNVVMSAVLPGAMLSQDGYWAKVKQKDPKKAKIFLQQNSPSKRFGKPEEISPMVVMLCSDQATYCHGAIVPIDGGQARHYYQLERS